MTNYGHSLSFYIQKLRKIIAELFFIFYEKVFNEDVHENGKRALTKLMKHPRLRVQS